MVSSGKWQNEVCLSIGGNTILLRIASTQLADRLRTRYTEYITHAQTQIAVDIEVEPGLRGDPYIEPSINFHDAQLVVSGANHNGVIDVQSGVGRYTLRSLYPIEEIDYYLRLVVALLAFESGGLLLHSAGVVHLGNACLFIGPSGSGKTTVSQHSIGKVILNDDLIVLSFVEGRWIACATPFTHSLQTPPSRASAPLAVMFFLVKDVLVSLSKLSHAQAVAELVASAPVVPMDAGRAFKLVDRCNQLVEVIPVYRLHFLPDASFWKIIDRHEM